MRIRRNAQLTSDEYRLGGTTYSWTTWEKTITF